MERCDDPHPSGHTDLGVTLPIVPVSASTPWPYGPDADSIVAQIVEFSKTLARSTPPPRDQPYFGLDALEPLPVPLLERLTTTGIFRKYEFVLDFTTELGAAARWLARSHGCRVLGIAPTISAALAARMLTKRANLAERVGTVAADSGHLPLRPGSFTHVWSIDALMHAPDRARLFSEAFRVLRSGGLFSAQETVAPDTRDAGSMQGGPSVGDPSADWLGQARGSLVTAAQYVDALRTAGFVDIRAEDMSEHAWDPFLAFEGARAKLLQRITEQHGADCAYLSACGRRAAITEARRRGLLRIYHFVATHPGSSS